MGPLTLIVKREEPMKLPVTRIWSAISRMARPLSMTSIRVVAACPLPMPSNRGQGSS
ncbi:hypothetical protein [Fictibacillus sp. NRS-1165]|uniref:hypothetical protein n=1 Tax=Fictibacillus sp. NRS-1165 TaxID=3144463 RepID=UPI003D1B330A